MKRIKNIAFSALLAIGAFGVVTFTACNEDECKDVVCSNGGTCSGGSCSCPVGYEGTSCQTLSSTKFVGSWRTTTEACTVSGSNSQYDIVVSASGTTAATLLISNLYDDSRTTTATLTGAGAFTINTQPFGSSGTITGTGSITNNQLSISYTVTVAGISDACSNVTYTKL